MKFIQYLVISFVLVELIKTSNVVNTMNRKIENHTPEIEQLLLNKLFKNYNKKLKPSGTVEIKFALNLNQIINLIEKDQIIVLNVFLDHEWTDNRLTWNPAEFNNISLLRVSSEFIWTPDTFVYTTADQTGFLLPQQGTYFVIQNNGVIFWPNPLTQMKLRCRMTIEWFPYDEQLCVIVFGSWSHTSAYLNYTVMTEEPSLVNYTENNEWYLISYKPSRSIIKYENWIEDDSFTEIKYKILIRRKSLFVLQNFVAPAVMLCILTLVSFFIPFAQEMQIGISILLSFAVFKLRLSDDVPVQADSIPLINVYFTLCISFSLSSMVWFSVVNLLKEKKPLPKSTRSVILKLIGCFVKKSSSLCNKLEKSNGATKRSLKIKCSEANATTNDEFGWNIKRSDTNSFYPDLNYPSKALPESTSLLSDIDFKKPTTINVEVHASNGSLNNHHHHHHHNQQQQQNYISCNLNNKKISINVNKNNNSSLVNSSKNRHQDIELSDLEVISILNKFVFTLFVIFIILLNIFSLYLLPFFIRVPLSINDS